MSELKPIKPHKSSESGSVIADKLEAIERSLEQQTRVIEQKDRTIEQLHQLAQQLTGDMFKKYMEPLVIQLTDYIHELEAQNTTTDSKSAQLNVARDLKAMLERFNLSSYRSAVGSPFNPQTHKAVDYIETPEAHLHRTVAKSVRDGYRWDDRVKWREQIVLYKLR